MALSEHICYSELMSSKSWLISEVSSPDLEDEQLLLASKLFSAFYSR